MRNEKPVAFYAPEWDITNRRFHKWINRNQNPETSEVTFASV